MKTCSSRTLVSALEAPPPPGGALAPVAHGLNNALTVITGFSELLLGVMSPGDPRRRYVTEIQLAGQHATELTHQLLTRPAATATARKSRAHRALRDLTHAPAHHEIILLVEDDPAVRDTVMHELVVLGYTVLEARDGPEALRVVAAQPDRRIDLLLTDVVMPAMDGCTLAARLRERQPGLKVVFSSGYTQDVALGKSPHRSCDGFLAKPYPAAALVHILGVALGPHLPPARPTRLAA